MSGSCARGEVLGVAHTSFRFHPGGGRRGKPGGTELAPRLGQWTEKACEGTRSLAGKGKRRTIAAQGAPPNREIRIWPWATAIAGVRGKMAVREIRGKGKEGPAAGKDRRQEVELANEDRVL